MDSTSNPDLQLAFDFVRYTNRNIFLTGKAGTGKTTFLHNLKKSSPKRMVVLAPTGVAAINAGGVTIHSFFQLPFHPYIPSLYLKKPGMAVTNEKRDSSGYRLSREKVNIIKSLDLLIIDEISMVRADTLDAIDAALRRYRNHHLPFGGVQMLMIGDLQQLAPVVREEDLEILGSYYTTLFFFGSLGLCCTDYVTIELKHIYRQKDLEFISILNKVRENRVDDEVLNELNKRYIPGFDTDSDGGYITLTTHNHQAQALNDARLEKLPARARSFKAVVKDEFPEISFPNENELILKEGAQVMFVKNDISRDKLFFNGKIGKVESFEEDAVIVKCPGDDLPIRVEAAEWQNVRYTIDEESKEIQETVIGTFTQFPLRLAWAVTIHKSQGLTFDRAVIDARAAFAHGQVYVALSRCRTLEGLVLNTRISRKCIIDDPVISGFVKETGQNPPTPGILAGSKRAYQRTLLEELFDFSPVARSLGYCLRIAREHHDSFLGNPQELFENCLSFIETDLNIVSHKFRNQLNTLLAEDADAESNMYLQERVKKAGLFFSEKLEEALKGLMSGVSAETDNKAVRKSFNDALKQLRKEGAIKLACLNMARNGFKISDYLDTRAKAAIDIPPGRQHPAKPDTASGGISHPDLFRLLREWRSARARELDLPHYMILPQKTMVSLANLLPRSMTSLRSIKGMGRKKSEQFGEDILKIIVTYCKKENIESPADLPAEKKAVKKIKKETKLVSYELYREGKTIEQIALERKLSITTVEEHLAHFVGTGDIPVTEFVSQEITDMITACLNGTDDLKIGPVKAVLGEKVSWSDIKFVVSHIRFLKKPEA